ncbi:MAG: hypothetical protein ACYTG0_27775 [Planctomycetota bacterium]|jgi:hypothetical protein
MKTYINLLPLEYRRRELLKRRLAQWALVWAGCLLLAGGVWWLKHGRYRASQSAVESAEQRYFPLAKLMQQRDVMHRELRELSARGTVLGQVRNGRPLFTLIGLTSKSARRSNGRLFVRRMAFAQHLTEPETAAQRSGAGRNAPAETMPWAGVTFQGEALDHLAIAKFAAALRDSGLFRRVELRSSVDGKSEHPDARSYLLECDI